MSRLTIKTFLVSLFNLILIIQNVRSSQESQGRLLIEQSVADTNNIFKHEVYFVNQQTFCSGSIIGDRHILTAAHCVVKKNSSEIIDIDRIGMIVEAGITNLHSLEERHTFRIVKKVYIPEKYYRRHEALENIGDIAVLELNHKLGLGVNPAITSLNFDSIGDAVYEKPTYVVTGFGASKIQIEFIPRLNESVYVPKNFSIQLRYAVVDVMDFNKCSVYLPINPEEQLCAIVANNREQKAGVCHGDSGGALLDYTSNTVIGVVSFGPPSCDDRDTPTVYTKVKHYISFINESIHDTPNPLIRTRSFEEHLSYKKLLNANPDLYREITNGEQTFY